MGKRRKARRERLVIEGIDPVSKEQYAITLSLSKIKAAAGPEADWGEVCFQPVSE